MNTFILIFVITSFGHGGYSAVIERYPSEESCKLAVSYIKNDKGAFHCIPAGIVTKKSFDD